MNPQQPIRFSCSRLSFGVAVLYFTTFISLLLQMQLSLRAEIKDLRRDVASAGQQAKAVFDKMEALERRFAPMALSVTDPSQFLFPTDQMFREGDNDW